MNTLQITESERIALIRILEKTAIDCTAELKRMAAVCYQGQPVHDLLDRRDAADALLKKLTAA